MKLDEQQQLTWDSEVSVAVLGRGGDFVLVNLADPIEDASKEAQVKGFHFCGVLAVKSGEPIAKCESDMDSVYTMMHAGLEFARLVADRLKQQQAGDAVAWLGRLYTLEDPR